MKIITILKETVFFWLINMPVRTSALDRWHWKWLALAGVDCKPSHILAPLDFTQYGQLKNIHIGEGCFINSHLRINVTQDSSVTIGDHVTIGPNVSLETVTHELDWNAQRARGLKTANITLQDKCWLAANVVVIGGVTIGEGSVVAAGAVVTKDVAPYTLVGGVPAQHIRDLEKPAA